MTLSLLDWRRRTAEIYAEVRSGSDPRASHAMWHAARDDLLRSHPDSPLPPDVRERFVASPVAPYDPSMRFEVQVEEVQVEVQAETDVASGRLEVPTGTDGIVPFERLGVVHLPDLGNLDVWWLASYGGGVFLPIKDSTAGVETYSGGRYLLDTVKGADLGGSNGWLVIDLNFAYNPSCAYDPAWACPLAPPGNTLLHPVRAGELVPGFTGAA